MRTSRQGENNLLTSTSRTKRNTHSSRLYHTEKCTEARSASKGRPCWRCGLLSWEVAFRPAGDLQVQGVECCGGSGRVKSLPREPRALLLCIRRRGIHVRSPTRGRPVPCRDPRNAR